MCGFVGGWGLPERPSPVQSENLSALLTHRGPDSSGELWRQGVWLGFRRLAVLDLDGRADQPMVDEQTGTALVLNGEIYNYLELRRALELCGHRFSTTGDTEVFLRGYLEWGVDAFLRCEGMFAAAILRPDGAVLLTRDRFGEKPLFYGYDGRSWWFGSEPGVVRAAGAGSGRVSAPRLLGFLGFGDIEDPQASYFEGIAQVPPGNSLVIDSGGVSRPVPWWSINTLLDSTWNTGVVEPEEVLETLDTAVRLRLRSDVTVGTSLSGGLDSSGVMASLRAVDGGRELHAFTASFPGSSLDEWGYAERVAASHSVVLHRVEPDPIGFLTSLPALVRAQGAPFDSPSVYAQWCVMQAAQGASVTVLLDGQGADETWGGYPKHAGLNLVGLMLSAHPDRAVAGANTWRRFGRVPRPPWVQAAGLLAPARARRWVAFAVGGRRVAGPALDDVRAEDPFGQDVSGGLLRRVAEFDLHRGLLPRLLRFADRNSMAWGREIRLPYLDSRMVELGVRSDWSAGLRTGWTKLTLRKSFAVRLPAEIVWRRDKIAYQAPDDDWLMHPTVHGAVCAATGHLVDQGILRPSSADLVSPWRRLSLSAFLEESRLTT